MRQSQNNIKEYGKTESNKLKTHYELKSYNSTPRLGNYYHVLLINLKIESAINIFKNF